MTHEKVRVMVETAERTFRGVIHKPVIDDRYRLSDHLNVYDKNFLCLSDVTINERGQKHRVGDKQDFVAISVNAITYVCQEEG